MRIAPNPELLEWAIQRSGKREELERRFPNLRKWLDGSLQPTLRQLEAFAKAAAVPFGYLLLQSPPQEQLSIPYFRTVDDQLRRPSPDLLDMVHIMQQRQEWMREYLIEQDGEPLPFVNSTTIHDKPLDIAQRIRETLALDERWAAKHATWTDALRALQARMEAVGILVVVNGVVGNNTSRKLNPADFRGFVLVDEYAPLVFINGADGKAAQMFTTAHELAHIWLGSSAAFDLRELRPADNKIEQLCNQVAAEVLVPEKQLRQWWLTVKSETKSIQAVARHFKVSEIVAARRLLDLLLISQSEFHDFYRDWQTRERVIRAKDDGGDFYKTQSLRIGKRFGEIVVRATKEGDLLYSEAYRLTGLSGKSFRRYAHEAFGMSV
jgi:Zn-dependent peptidase ImmA (M78 family)